MKKECEKYQKQQQYDTHSASSIDASALNLTQPTINTSSRDEPSSMIGQSGSSSIANEFKHSEPARSLATEPMALQTNLTSLRNASKISKREDLLSLASPDSGFGTQPSRNSLNRLSPTASARSISALLKEAPVTMPSLLLGITDFCAAETSSQQSRQRDGTSNNNNPRARHRSQTEHRTKTSVPFVESIKRTNEKKVLLKKKEANDPSKPSVTTTVTATTSKLRKFTHYKSKTKDKNPKRETANSLTSSERIVSSEARTKSQEKASSQALASLAMKMPVKTSRQTCSHVIESSLKLGIQYRSSSMTRSCASGSSCNSDRSRSGSSGSVVAPPSSKRLRIHD